MTHTVSDIFDGTVYTLQFTILDLTNFDTNKIANAIPTWHFIFQFGKIDF